MVNPLQMSVPSPPVSRFDPRSPKSSSPPAPPLKSSFSVPVLADDGRAGGGRRVADRRDDRHTEDDPRPQGEELLGGGEVGRNHGDRDSRPAERPRDDAGT